MEHLLSPDSSDAYNVFGEPELFPRVGDQYQVEIPPMMIESEYRLYTKNPFEVDFLPGVPFDFLMGLPIPITLKVEPPNIGLENGIGFGDHSSLASDQEMKRKIHKYGGKPYCLVPGSSGGSWSDVEESSFLLGLYIFGKNLVQMVRLPEDEKQKVCIWAEDFHGIEATGIVVATVSQRVGRMPKYFGGVASEPGLLELHTETNESNRNKEENGRTSETKLEQDDLSERKPHCYLQSRTPNHSTDLMKFTVVDTSLADAKVFRVIDLRTLPLEDSTKTTFRSHSEGNDKDSSEVSSEDSDSMDTVLFDLKENNVSNSKKSACIFQMGSKHRGVPISNSNSGNAYFKKTKDFTKFSDCKKPREFLKCCKMLKEDTLNSLALVTKRRRRRLLSCTWPEVSHGMLSFSVSQNFSSSETTDSSGNNLHGMKKRVLSTISPKGIFCDTNFGGEAAYEKPQSRPLIDLNLPQVLPDFETVEASTIELKQPESSTAPKTSSHVTCSKPNGNSRRQSTRNRPPTVRALEALANGFLTTGRRRNKETSSREASRSRPRRAHGGMVVTGSFGNGFVTPPMGKVGNGVCNSKSDMFSKFQVLSEGNVAKVSEP
ncbi:hypothetical protein Acr_29g0009810 [Actinidia rufa]|uniref:Uncharacterized protein n=1 Tax=Actinidia rufa TaxID=165716 RepID=A0A7J0HFG5_9ERIC|nr:hypothetical protein Acr_29g0009810 [Actinidia rufa]